MKKIYKKPVMKSHNVCLDIVCDMGNMSVNPNPQPDLGEEVKNRNTGGWEEF